MLPKSARIAAAAMLTVLSAGAQKKTVSLEAVASQPPADRTTISWAPGGARFLYIEKDQLMAYDCASGRPEKLAALPRSPDKGKETPLAIPFHWENRRVSGSQPEWSREGRHVLHLHDGDLYLLETATEKWTRLTDTPEAEADPHLSPDGSHAAFRRGHDLYAINLENRRTWRLTSTGSATVWNGKLDWVYPEELGLGRAWWWSPDSRSIAFLEFDVAAELLHPQVDADPSVAVYEPQRYPKAGTPNPTVRLGVVSPGTGAVRWMSTGANSDQLLARVQWMPDSKRLAVQRFPRVQNRLEVWSVDAGTGESKLLLEEKSETWVNLHDALHFLPDGRFIWAQERDGFRHLFLHNENGSQERRLTEGEWEVTSVEGVTKESVYFTSTRKSPLERNLYRVGLNGGDPQLLTPRAGTHTISMSPAGDFFVDTFSSVNHPPEKSVRRADGTQTGTLREADRSAIEEYGLQPVEHVTFTSGVHRFDAQIIKPAGFQSDRKYPAIVIVYGGPHSQMVRNSWGGVSWEQALAAKGFVVWRMDNRGSSGRGHVWEAPLYRRFGKVELEDQLAGVKYLTAQGFVDEKRIGIYGWSYGGYMTLYALANAPSTFAAGIAGAAVTDWRLYDTIYTERYLGLPAKNADGYRESSAITYAGKIKSPVLLVHNFEDDNVLFQNAQNMMAALQKEGKAFEVMFYPQKAHAVTGAFKRHMLETTTQFFERHLRP